MPAINSGLPTAKRIVPAMVPLRFPIPPAGGLMSARLALLAVSALLVMTTACSKKEESAPASASGRGRRRRARALEGRPAHRARQAHGLLGHSLRAVRVQRQGQGRGRPAHRLRRRGRPGHGGATGAQRGLQDHALRHDHRRAGRRQLRHDRLGHDHHRRKEAEGDVHRSRTSTPTSRC